MQRITYLHNNDTNINCCLCCYGEGWHNRSEVMHSRDSEKRRQRQPRCRHGQSCHRESKFFQKSCFFARAYSNSPQNSYLFCLIIAYGWFRNHITSRRNGDQYKVQSRIKNNFIRALITVVSISISKRDLEIYLEILTGNQLIPSFLFLNHLFWFLYF